MSLMSGYSNKTGCGNVCIGALSNCDYSSGVNNVTVGKEAGVTSFGSSNVFIGYQAGYSINGNNKLCISNTSNRSLIYGEFENEILTFNAQVTICDLLVMKPRSTAPSSPEKGTIYFDSNDNKLKVSDGNTWCSLR